MNFFLKKNFEINRFGGGDSPTQMQKQCSLFLVSMKPVFLAYRHLIFQHHFMVHSAETDKKIYTQMQSNTTAGLCHTRRGLCGGVCLEIGQSESTITAVNDVKKSENSD